MSEYSVISATDETLQALLWAGIEHDPVLNGIIGTEQQVSSEPPFRILTNNEPDQESLSLYLYRVIENPDMKNRPLLPENVNRLRYPPLSLSLFYLMTPVTNSAENDHLVLGRAMQIMYDNAILKGSALQGVLQNTTEELRIILNPISMDDINKIWSAFMRPYRLSLSYEVKVVFIDSERELGGERVVRKRIEYSQTS